MRVKYFNLAIVFCWSIVSLIYGFSMDDPLPAAIKAFLAVWIWFGIGYYLRLEGGWQFLALAILIFSAEFVLVQSESLHPFTLLHSAVGFFFGLGSLKAET